MEVVSRPDKGGPLLLNSLYVQDLGAAEPPSEETSSINTKGSIFGKPLPLTAEQRAAWRSKDEVAQFPQTPKEVAIWRAIERESL